MNSKNKLVNSQSIDGIFIGQFKTTQSGILSYYIESDRQSCLIDPIYDVSAYLEFIEERKSKLSFVGLTHYQQDYISGHSQLQVTLMMGPNSTRPNSKLKVVQNKDGTELKLGSSSVKILHTPGHTLQSTCFVVSSSSHKDVAIFTGDTVLIGFTGRTNLEIEGYTAIQLAQILFESIQKIKKLEKNVVVYPGHCMGAFTSRALGLKLFSTLEEQLVQNSMMTFTQKADFVNQSFKMLLPPPKFFNKVQKINEDGAPNFKTSVNNIYRTLKLQEFLQLRQLKLIDTRTDIGQGFLKGSYWFPSNGPINFWVHNFLTQEQRFIIVAKEGQGQDIIKRLLRIGYFNVQGVVQFDLNLLGEQRITPQILKFKTYHEYKDKSHIDVRSPDEYLSDGIIEGTIRIPLFRLQERIQQIRNMKNIVVSCGSGRRARVSFSVLARQGIISKVLVEDLDKFNDNGLSVVPFK